MARQNIDPIPYTLRRRAGKFFGINLSEEDLKDLSSKNNNLQYYTVHNRFLQDSTRRRIGVGCHNAYGTTWYISWCTKSVGLGFISPSKTMQLLPIMSPSFLDVSTHAWCVDIYQRKIHSWHWSYCTFRTCTLAFISRTIGKRTEKPNDKMYASMKRLHCWLLLNIAHNFQFSGTHSTLAEGNLFPMVSILLLTKAELPVGTNFQSQKRVARDDVTSIQSHTPFTEEMTSSLTKICQRRNW